MYNLDCFCTPVACWVNVPVVGGHAGTIVLPWFSQAFPQANLSYQDIEALTKRTQDGGIEVVNRKAGKGLATWYIAEFQIYSARRTSNERLQMM